MRMYVNVDDVENPVKKAQHKVHYTLGIAISWAQGAKGCVADERIGRDCQGGWWLRCCAYLVALSQAK